MRPTTAWRGITGSPRRNSGRWRRARGSPTGATAGSSGSRGPTGCAGCTAGSLSRSPAGRPHQPTESLILSPNGHIEHHLELVDDGEAVWAHVEPGTTPALVEFLEKMKFMLRVEVSDVTESYAVVNGAAEGLRVLRGDVLVPRAELAVPDGLRPVGLWAY